MRVGSLIYCGIDRADKIKYKLISMMYMYSVICDQYIGVYKE